MSHVQVRNILIVSHYYPPHIGGIEIVAFNQAKQLAKAGCTVTVVTSRVSTQEDIELNVEGIKVIRIEALNFLEKWGIPFPIFSPRLFWVMFKLIRNVDVVHVHDAFYISSLVAVLCGYWHKKPIALTQHVEMVAHSSTLVRIIQKIVYATSGKLVFRLSHKIITINDRVEKFLIKQSVPKDKILSLPNGVDSDVFYPVSEQDRIKLKREFGLNVGKKSILFVGRFVPKKGFDIVLDAIDSEYQIIFVGGDVPKIIPPGVVFLGKLEQSILANVYQCADVFVLPSKDEGFPLSVQEAMASGLPVITTADDGYARYNLDKNRVCLIPNPTNDTVRQAIKSIIHNTSRMQKMAEYSYGYARAKFSWPIVVQKLMTIYNELIVKK